MPKFKYTAINPKGQRLEDSVEADSSKDVIKMLEESGLVPVKVEKQGQFLDISSLQEITVGGIPLREKVLLFKQLSLMFNAGLPLSKIFDILSKQDLYPPIKKIIKEATQDILGGEKLHQAFAKHPELFDKFSIALIRAGEESGQLDMIFRKLSSYYTHKHKLSNSIKSALAYPIAVLIIVFLVLAFILWFILPQMYEVFDEFRVNLPITTKMLIFLSVSLRKYYWAYILVLLLIGVGIYQTLKLKEIRKILDLLLPKMPVVGKIYYKIQVSNIINTLSMLLAGGVPIVKALELTKEITQNYWYKLEIENMEEYVKMGKRISDYLKTSKMFP